MKKVIVTGGAGFIGSNLVKKLLDLNVEKLLIIDDLSTGNESNISSIVNDERVEFLNSKIEDNYENKSSTKIFNKKVYENKSFFGKLAFKINKKLEIISKFLKTYYT